VKSREKFFRVKHQLPRNALLRPITNCHADRSASNSISSSDSSSPASPVHTAYLNIACDHVEAIRQLARYFIACLGLDHLAVLGEFENQQHYADQNTNICA